LGSFSISRQKDKETSGRKIADLSTRSKDVEPKEVRGIIAGGGTGGHLHPGLAIAREICRRSENAELLFVTGRRKMELDILNRTGFLQASIDVEGLKGRGWFKGLRALVKLPLSFFQSFSIIRGFSPNIVIGVGGYSAGPVCVLSRLMGIPSAIHEQNSYPGLTNRILCRVVDKVFISFEESRAHFPGGSLLLTGNPILEEFLAGNTKSGEKNQIFTILIVGGSQGAHAINRSMVETLKILKERGKVPGVIHQTGETDYKEVVEAYRREGVKGEVLPFIEDMGRAYSQADLVIGRAGAATVSELAALGKPSILIPYPHAANRHQETNAQMLVRAGGAEMMLEETLSGQRLAESLMRYMNDRPALTEMGQRAKKVGRGDAAGIIVDQLMEMIK
jgi:UDP-N-acetylglucosamine--N-acetylmuramyl-(pentapeptide) pyrophosphoryl-undecaprenol N-acetylglucosamine transferase